MTDYDDAWPDVSCALPDLRYVVYAAIGGLVIAAALGIAAVKRFRCGKA